MACGCESLPGVPLHLMQGIFIQTDRNCIIPRGNDHSMMIVGPCQRAIPVGVLSRIFTFWRVPLISGGRLDAETETRRSNKWIDS